MAILVPDQAELGLGRSEIQPREVFAGMKDPGNAGAGLASLAKALGELGSTFADLGAKQKAQQEEAGMATAYWDATVEGAPAGYDGAVGPGRTVGERKPTLFDVNNFNSRAYDKVEIRKRQFAGSRETAAWLGESGYLDPPKIPASVRDNPEAFEGYLDAGRKKIIERYRSDPVSGSAALQAYDDEADKLRTATGNQRAKDFEDAEIEDIQRGLNGTGDDFNLDDPAEVSPLQTKAPSNSAYKTRGRAVVPAVQDAVQQVAGDSWLGDYMIATARVESSGGRNLANPSSSARGPWQFIESTGRRYGLNSEAQRLDPYLSAQAMAKFTLEQRRGLVKALGREPSFAELYLAHQQGLGGAVKLLTNPNVRAADIVGAKAVKLNGGKMGMTSREFAGLWLNKFNKINGLTNERGGSAPDGDVGLQIASNDPNFMPQMGGEGKSWAAERYGADADEGKFNYETPPGEERYVNADGDEVVFVPDDPMVLGERRKVQQMDKNLDTSSTLSRPKRRDIYFDHYYNKAIEAKDPRYLDVLPPTWLTPDQRAKTAKLRDQMVIDKDQDKLRQEQLRRVEKERERDAKRSDIIKRRGAGEEIDPYKEALQSDGTLDDEVFKFARDSQNWDTVPTRVSNGNRVLIESAILSSVDSGSWEKLGFDGPPTEEELVRFIQNNPELTNGDKNIILERLDKLQEGSNVLNSPATENLYNNTIGLTVKNLTQGAVNPANPASVVAYAGLGQQARQFFDQEVAALWQTYMEDNNGAVPKGSALRQIQQQAVQNTTQWLSTYALPFVQQQANTPQTTGTNAQGNPMIQPKQLQLPSLTPSAPQAPATTGGAVAPAQPAASGYTYTTDENGRRIVIRNPN